MGVQSMCKLVIRCRRAVIFVTALAAIILVPSFSLFMVPAFSQQTFTRPTAKPVMQKTTIRSKAAVSKQKRKGIHAAKSKVAPVAAQIKTSQAAPLTAPAPTSGEGVNIGEFQPVLHARTAKLTTCMDQVVSQSNSVIDRPHTAISSWSKTQPNKNFFRSIIGLSSPNKTMPNGAAVLVAAPLPGGRCGGSTVQIYATAQSCTSIQALLVQKKKTGRIGRTAAMLRDLPVVVTADGASNILMPTAGSGCVMIIVQNVQ